MQYAVVGAYFRPPAKAILQVLPTGTPLVLRPEPTNQYDANAIQVIVATSDIPQDDLEAAVCGYGFTLEEVLAKPEWHLGYIPRVDAVDLAPKLGSKTVSGELAFGMKGQPMVTLADELPVEGDRYMPDPLHHDFGDSSA